MPKKRPQPVREKCEKGHELTYANTLRRRKGTYVVRLCRTCRNEYQAQRRAEWRNRRERTEQCFCVYCRETFPLTYETVRTMIKSGRPLVCPSCKPLHEELQRPPQFRVTEASLSFWENHESLTRAQVLEVAHGFCWDDLARVDIRDGS